MPVSQPPENCPHWKASHGFCESPRVKELEAENRELKDFAIWMTGCGYDFCQHECFCRQRDKLLKDKLLKDKLPEDK